MATPICKLRSAIGNPADLVDCGANNGEIEPIFAANVAVEHLADMETQIHFRRRRAFLETSLMEDSDRLSRLCGGVKRRGAGLAASPGGEYRERPTADQLQQSPELPWIADTIASV
jgi:hypothetical protein